MPLEPYSKPRRRSVVVLDERRAAGTLPGIPGPPEIAHAVFVHPGHEPVDVSMPAVVLPDLARDHGNPAGEGSDRAVPARTGVAVTEVVVVPGGGEIVRRIQRLMSE